MKLFARFREGFHVHVVLSKEDDYFRTSRERRNCASLFYELLNSCEYRLFDLVLIEKWKINFSLELSCTFWWQLVAVYKISLVWSMKLISKHELIVWYENHKIKSIAHRIQNICPIINYTYMYWIFNVCLFESLLQSSFKSPKLISSSVSINRTTSSKNGMTFHNLECCVSLAFIHSFMSRG